ncbi:DUF397 domain-containing protein [Streptomyces sp. NPDC005774]|uniref:DUF397 domain-containing protein n=1 Tax=Streptomyces sp. NPDC005774 TaxID=3364728 RepID=UPI0036A73CFB
MRQPDISNCVETTATATTVLIRDSKDAAGLRLGFSRPAWAALVAYVDETGAPGPDS